MSKLTLFATAAVLLCCLGLAVAEPSHNASDDSQQSTQNQQDHQQYEANYRGNANRSQQATTVRVSEILGLSVMAKNSVHSDQQAQNRTNSNATGISTDARDQAAERESVGEVEDLVLDPQSGKIRYAAISIGGFLDMGDKLVAVSWDSLQCHTDEDGNHYLTIDRTKQELENARGFDQNNWPERADQAQSSEDAQHSSLSANM